MKLELDKLLKASKARLDTLGPQRSTTTEQISYLVKLASNFQAKTSAALDASYSRDDMFEKNEWLLLANNIMNRNEAFSSDFEKYGHNYDFKKAGLEKADFCDLIFGEEELEDLTREFTTPIPLISDIVDEGVAHRSPASTSIAKWLDDLYARSRGFELGTFDPKLLASAMKQQTTKWQDICRGYVSDVISLTHWYIENMLRELCSDQRVIRGLWGLLTDKILTGYKNALNQVDFVLNVERSMKPTTQNHYFNENLQKGLVHQSPDRSCEFC